MMLETLFPFLVFHNEEANSETIHTLPYKLGNVSIMMSVVGFGK